MLDIRLQTENRGKKVIKKAPKFTLVPIIIENYSTPRLATDEEAARILGKIGEASVVLGTQY